MNKENSRETFNTHQECIEEDEYGIIITDAPSKPFESMDNISKEYLRDNADSVFMVHATDFFPRNHKILNNYDGNLKRSKIVTYKGAEKECTYLDHRHTVHFTMNARVRSTGDGMGNWDDTRFMVVEPLKSHVSEFASLDASDGYTVGSVELSDEAILFIRKDAYDEMSEEEQKEYKVIRYEGEPSKCLENFLILNGYNVFETHNHPGHFGSQYMNLEDSLNLRDAYINYIRDNQFTRGDIALTNDEFYDVFNIAKENKIRTTTGINEVAKENNISPEFLSFFINSGFSTTPDGKVMLKSDEEILKVFLDLNKEYKKIENGKREEVDYQGTLENNGINIEEIKGIYEAYLQAEKKKELEPIIKEVLSRKREDFGLDENWNLKSTQQEQEVYEQLTSFSKINEGLLDKEITAYEFYEYPAMDGKMYLALSPKDLTESEITKKLEGMPHCNIDEYGSVILDFEMAKDETVGEYLERLTKYTDNFSKFYDGNDIDESIQFDENGDIIETPNIGKSDFEQVANSREAVTEMQSGQIVAEIREEMQGLNKNQLEGER